MRVLIVKTSSLGDLIHTLPALTDAAASRNDLVVDWMTEAVFAEIPAWHSAVCRVVASDLRGWRRHPFRMLASDGWPRFRRELRSLPYDLIIDAQGLLKSAWLARRAIGPIAGPDRRSAREPLAALFYRYRYVVPQHTHVHAIERNRKLFAQALGYPLPARPPMAGLEPGNFSKPDRVRPYAMLLHGTSWSTKRWPEAYWTTVGQWFRERGIDPLLPWGSIAERESAERIARAGGGEVLSRQTLTALAGLLAHAKCFVGLDTGLSHVGAALGTRGITLYGPTLPHLTGTLGPRQVHLTSGDPSTVDRARPTTVEVSRVLNSLRSWV